MNNTAKNNGIHFDDHEWAAPIEDHRWAPANEKVHSAKLHVVATREAIRDQEAEQRLEDLSSRLQDLNAASHLIWLKSGLDNRDPVLDLRNKVESVRWMLRIAKHLSTSAREMLFANIRKVSRSN